MLRDEVMVFLGPPRPRSMPLAMLTMKRVGSMFSISIHPYRESTRESEFPSWLCTQETRSEFTFMSFEKGCRYKKFSVSRKRFESRGKQFRVLFLFLTL